MLDVLDQRPSVWVRIDGRREQQIQQVLLRWIVPEPCSDAPKDQPTVPAEYPRPPSRRDIQRVVAVFTLRSDGTVDDRFADGAPCETDVEYIPVDATL